MNIAFHCLSVLFHRRAGVNKMGINCVKFLEKHCSQVFYIGSMYRRDILKLILESLKKKEGGTK